MYFLSRDSYVCATGGYWIVLNAERDEYLGVPEESLHRAGPCLYGWSHGNERTNTQETMAGRIGDFVRSLVSKGVLTDDPKNGKPFACTCFDAPENALVVPPFSRRHTDSLRFTLGFLRASVSADYKLRTQRLLLTLRTIEHRRMRLPSRDSDFDYDRATTLVSAFRSLRPLYPRRYLCLFDSLALLEFLAPHRLFPRWVFGVIADPFSAHCWLQAGSIVINDQIERVRRYTSIMVK